MADKKNYKGIRETSKWKLSGKSSDYVYPLDDVRDLIESEFGRDNGTADKIEKMLWQGETVIRETPDGCIRSFSLTEDEPMSDDEFAVTVLSQLEEDLPPEMFDDILGTFPDEFFSDDQ